MSEDVELTSGGPEPLEIEVVTGTFSLRAKGSKSVARIGDYLANVIGIIGEPAGIITDAWSNYRVYRREAAAAAMIRANEISREKGKRLENVSPKFLSPWIEGASQEDLGSENILELWATLLAMAPNEVDTTLLALVDLCKRIGPTEAQLISQLVGPRHCRSLVGRREGYWYRVSVGAGPIRNIRTLNRFAEKFLSGERSPEECVGVVNQLQSKLFGKVADVRLFEGMSGVGAGLNREPMDVLEYLGVVRSEELHWGSTGRRITAVLFQPTTLGARFFEILNWDLLYIDDENGKLSHTQARTETRKRLRQKPFSPPPSRSRWAL